jgi:hypothetical protein
MPYVLVGGEVLSTLGDQGCLAYMQLVINPNDSVRSFV